MAQFCRNFFKKVFHFLISAAINLFFLPFSIPFPFPLGTPAATERDSYTVPANTCESIHRESCAFAWSVLQGLPPDPTGIFSQPN